METEDILDPSSPTAQRGHPQFHLVENDRKPFHNANVRSGPIKFPDGLCLLLCYPQGNQS